MSTFDVTLRNPRDVEIAALADELAAEIAQTARQYDESGEFPHAHFELLHRHGALALTIPTEYGGQGLSLYQTLLFQERLARGSGSTALSLGWHLMIFGCLSLDLKWDRAVFEKLAGDVVQRGDLLNVLVTEREAGNLLRGARPGTIARKTAQGYVISGRKAFCSSAPALRQMIVYAFVEEEGRAAEFLVTKSEGVEVIETWNSIGMRSTGSHDIVFHDVVVPHSALLSYIDIGKVGTFAVGSRAFGLQMAAIYLGIATAARDFAVEFAANYHSHSLGHVILDAPQVQQKLGEIEFLIGTTKTLLYGLAERWEHNKNLRGRLEKEVSITKVAVGKNAIRIVELAVSIVGGHALSRDYPLERYFRDVQCSAFNPPQDDTVISNLAKAATTRHRATREEAPAAQAPAATAAAPATTPEVAGESVAA